MRNEMQKGRILLVGEDKLFGFKIKHMLEQEEDMEIVGDCNSAEQALFQMETLSPNIVLMDSSLSETNGIEACRRLTEKQHTCDVIMLTASQELTEYAMKAGATSCYPKELKHEELVTAIRLACKWQSIKAKRDDSVYSIGQIEAMIMEHLTKSAAEQTCNKREPEWPLAEGDGSNPVLEELRLVIPLPDDVSCLQRFISLVEEKFQASILETVGSRSGIHVTLKLRMPVSSAYILDKLMQMPEVEKVEKVEEKIPVKAGRLSFFRKIKPVLQEGISVILSGQVQPLPVAEQEPQYLGLPKLQPQMVGAMVS